MIAFLNPFKRLVIQFLLLLAFYAASRLCFTLINLTYFEGITVGQFLLIALGALRFDLSALLIINSLYFLLYFVPLPFCTSKLWQRLLQFIFIASNSVAFFFELSDWAYFPFNGKRSTGDVLNMVSHKSDFINLLPSFAIDYWYVPLAALIFLIAFIKINQIICRKLPLIFFPKHKILHAIFLLLLTAGLSIIGIRGGLQRIPIGIRNAVQVAENRFVPIVLNTPFSMINSWQNDKLKPLNYFDAATLKKYINTTKKYTHSSFKQKNVVIIILESFSKEFTGIGGMTSYTPFLDSLMAHSFICNNAFANGIRSAEGIPAILSSIPSLQDEPFTTSFYGTNRITSLPNLLAKKGYSSAFYHGGTNGTMSFDVYAANADFQFYKGRTEYHNEKNYDGNWGIWDEPFLQYAAKDISTSLQDPFCASIFTLSSHHPFKVPQEYKNVFPKGKLPIIQTIGYTDNALRLFFAAAQKEKWFANTLFVFTADHAASQSNSPYYNFHQGRYAIPIFYYSPTDTSLRGQSDVLTQQLDILPSVMDYLGYSDSFFAFGNSIFSAANHRFAIQYSSSVTRYTSGNYFLEIVNNKVFNYFNFKADPLSKDNLLYSQPDSLNATLPYYKAFQQAYNSAMIANKLWLP